MNEPALWNLALQAFAAVIVVLTVLAGAVALLSRAFGPGRASVAAVTTGRGRAATSPIDASPQPSPKIEIETVSGFTPDAFVTAAIHAAVRELAPGARVTRIEETR